MTREQMIDKAARRVLVDSPYGNFLRLFTGPNGYKLTPRGTLWKGFAPDIRAEFRRISEAP